MNRFPVEVRDKKMNLPLATIPSQKAAFVVQSLKGWEIGHYIDGNIG
jgi:hypothetical protein